jgi:hypothetical protein
MLQAKKMGLLVSAFEMECSADDLNVHIDPPDLTFLDIGHCYKP